MYYVFISVRDSHPGGKQKELDYLLFFGKTTHAYVARKITPTIPWDVIPRTNATLFLILFKALLNGSNVYSLATDLHPAEKKMLYDSYQEVGVDLSKVTVDYAPSFTFDEMFVSKMKDFYYRCRQKDPNVTCITIYSEVYNHYGRKFSHRLPDFHTDGYLQRHRERPQ